MNTQECVTAIAIGGMILAALIVLIVNMRISGDLQTKMLLETGHRYERGTWFPPRGETLTEKP